MMIMVVYIEDRGDMMTEERCDMMIMMVVPTQVLTSRIKISLDTFCLLWFGSSPKSPRMCEKLSFKVFEDKLMRSINMYYLVGDDNRLFTESWNLWNASDRICWIYNFWLHVFFYIYFSFLLLSPILTHQYVLRLFTSGEVDSQILIRVPPECFITYQSQIVFCSIIMYYFFIYWIGMTVCLVTSSYAATCRTIFLDDDLLPFLWRTTIGSSVLVTCN